MNDRAPDRIFRYVPHDDIVAHEAAGWCVVPARTPHRVMDCYCVLMEQPAQGGQGRSLAGASAQRRRGPPA